MPNDGNNPEVPRFRLPQSVSASLTLDADSAITLAGVRAWARDLIGGSTDVELLLTELVANAREHGQQGPIIIEVEGHDNEVTIVVTNPNVADSSMFGTGADRVATTSVRGRGLQIAKAVSDKLRVEQIGPALRVSATVHLP